MTTDAAHHVDVPRDDLATAGAASLDALIGQLDSAAVLRIAVGICDALAQLHDVGLMHHDVRPCNVLVSPSSGVAWLRGHPDSLAGEGRSLDQTSTVTAGLPYLAPERTGRLASLVDCRADLYSLGVTLYQAVTGELPFAVSEPREWVHAHVAGRPIPPADRARLPEMLSSILLKLLEKDPDCRYQSASSVAYDLRECLSRLDANGDIAPFPLGSRDLPKHLSRRWSLRGRLQELELLSSAVERVQRTAALELVLVAGSSGIGKSSLVSELLARRLPADTLAVTAKADDLETDAPYAALMQALREMCRWVVAKPASELHDWRAALLDALGSNAGMVAELVPELGWILGTQPHIASLPAEEARTRVFVGCRQLLRTFAERQRPLVIFLDDLQWLDVASLGLLEHLLQDPELSGVLLIGAYRTETVSAEHPLLSAVDRLRRAARPVQTLLLGPLSSGEVEALIVDVLSGAPEQRAELTRIVEHKTAGNPFYVRQFLTALKEEQLLRFDPDGTSWAWEQTRVLAKGPTDNLADLLVERLRRLPTHAQRALETLACLGVRSSASLLAALLRVPFSSVRERLQPALHAGVVAENEEGYAFSHDRLLTAAYSRIPKGERAWRHLELARALRDREDGLVGDNLFEVVRHMNRAAVLLRDAQERIELAQLNSEAARRSRASAAFANALPYLEQAWSLLPEDHWRALPSLSFELALGRAESAFLSGARARAEALLADLAARDLDDSQLGAVVCVRLPLLLTSNRADEAVELGLGYLRRVGASWQSIDADALRVQYERLSSALGNLPVAALADAPALQSPAVQRTMEVCAVLVSPAYFSNPTLFALLTMHMATLSIQNGHCESSAFAYALLCLVLGPNFGAHELGLAFGQLGSQLAERGANRFAAHAWLVMGAIVAPRTLDPHAGQAWLVRACAVSDQFGDLLYSVYTRSFLVASLLGSGAPLEEVERQAEIAIAHARRSQFQLLADRICILRAFIRGLRRPNWTEGSLSDEELDESSYELALGPGPDRYYYWVRRTQARYYAGDFHGAREASRRARQLMWTSPLFPEESELWLFGALAEAACPDASDAAAALEILAADERELLVWAGRCPATFASKAALVSGEAARLSGRELEAEQHLERAAALARQHQLVHEEALAHELSARLYAERGIESVARAKLSAARACYLQWGAHAKASRLAAGLPPEPEFTPEQDLSHSLEQLDVSVLVSALQAVSGSLDLDALLDGLMRATLQHAGAERGVLVLHRGEPRVRAQATSQDGSIRVSPDDTPLAPELVPESVVRYVIRSRERLLVRDGAVPPPFRGDAYFAGREVRALACLPLLAHGHAVAALYLESTLTRQAFSPRGLAVLEIITSQAAISLENAHLYADLHEAQQRMARAEHVSRTASFSWRPGSREPQWSDEVSNIYGIQGQPTIHQLRERTHPEDRALFDSMVNQSGRYDGQPVELRLLMPSGAIKHLAVIASRLTENEYVGTIRDVTEAKQTEEALQRTQAALTDMTRVASLGEMAAAIAHEVNQPLSAIGLNASTCLRWLENETANLGEAREAALRIRRDASRAAAVVQRLRALFSKSEGFFAAVDVNDAISEVVALARSRVRAAGAALTLELKDGLPHALGDRVQLQQVLMNLLMNALDSVKSQEEGARALTIRTLHVGPTQILCEVQDSGRGVTAADQARIFEPFYTTKPDGMGIGLSICKNIVSTHGGELSVRSNGQAPGATFYFTLPLPSAT